MRRLKSEPSSPTLSLLAGPSSAAVARPPEPDATNDAADVDVALIRAHRTGDTEAFGQIFDRYRDRVFRLLYRLTFDKEDALDLCQLTFLKVYRALGVYERQGSFYTWLYRIAVNTALDHLRDRRKRPKATDADLLDAEARALKAKGPPLREPDVTPVEALLRKELEDEVARAVGRLPAAHRATLLLRAAEGLSYREIATVLECPPGTVMSRLHAAREQLRASLARYLDA
jgi:RNA polymerase sigma-70 factor (ECF subfamily)